MPLLHPAEQWIAGDERCGAGPDPPAGPIRGLVRWQSRLGGPNDDHLSVGLPSRMLGSTRMALVVVVARYRSQLTGAETLRVAEYWVGRIHLTVGGGRD